MPLAPLFGMPGARFDPLKIHWLGSMDRSDGPCTAWHTSPIKTWADMLDKEFIVGSSGVGSQMDVYPAVMNKLFGTKMKVIGGYKDGALDLPRHGARGDSRPLRPAAHLDRLAAPAMADREEDQGADRGQRAPHAACSRMRRRCIELAKDEPTRQQIRLLIVSQDLDRPVLAPPGVPAERVKLLRDAFNATMVDPAFLADIKKLRLTLDWVSGEDVTKTLAAAYAMPPDVVVGGEGDDGREIAHAERRRQGLRRRRSEEREGMFAKINHVAIVSEKYALITKFYEAAVRDVPVQDLAEVARSRSATAMSASTSIRARPDGRPGSTISASRSRTSRPRSTACARNIPTPTGCSGPRRGRSPASPPTIPTATCSTSRRRT